ncbi:MAG: hypothetical protein KDE53_34895, partial [Caldilineaceae bacterium]|nr:hypothetical protein [Caldilineaceae bacterium]
MLIDLDTVTGIDTGPTFTRDLAAASSPNQDTDAFDRVGKYSLGDLEIDGNSDHLYVANLYDRTLVAIDLSTSAVIDSYAIPDPGCANANDVRPMGLGVRGGEVYVGVVCSAETSGLSSDLQAAVFKLTPAGGFTTVVAPFALTYTMPDRFDGTARSWNAWVSTYPLAAGNAAYRDTYPQPLLADIDWDASGNMLLSFRDRFGDQTGEEQAYPAGFTPGANNPGNEVVWTHTQILQACATASGWTTGGACAVNFYDTRVAENASTTGGLLSLPTQGGFIAAVADPISILQQGAARWAFGTATYTTGTAYVADSDTAGPAQFAKGNGLGDVEALCDPAPIEVGNRVWNDADSNGTQDPDELPIAGVVVTLHNASGTQLASVTTNADGEYFFSNATSGPQSGSHVQYNISGLTYNTSGYEIRIANAEGGSQQTPLSGLFVTTADADEDFRDSDGTLDVTTAKVVFDTGGPGANNHTYDFGFTAAQQAVPATLQIDKQVSGGNVPDPFNVTVSGPNGYRNSVAVTPGTPTVITDLDPGVYTVVEESPISIVAPTGLAWLGTIYQPAEGTIALANGDSGTVTITNVLGEVPVPPTGVLTVTKTVDWNGTTPDAGQQFAYTIEGPSGFTTINDTITNGGEMTYSVPSGVYTVTETSPGAGWVTT